MGKVYIYSNSTRETKRLLQPHEFEVDSKHVFVNDCQPLVQNKWLQDAAKHKMLVISFDSWEYVRHWKTIFDNNITFDKIITCSAIQYCNMDPVRLQYTSVDGRLQNEFDGIKRNLTTGARAYLICKQVFPNDEIVLVNFSDKADPTYGKCKTHDVAFEEKMFAGVQRLSI